MTVFQFALVRAAAKRMEPHELKAAMKLADLADDGVESAWKALERMVDEVLFDPKRQEKKP
jgi:hypothetical protein